MFWHLRNPPIYNIHTILGKSVLLVIVVMQILWEYSHRTYCKGVFYHPFPVHCVLDRGVCT